MATMEDTPDGYLSRGNHVKNRIKKYSSFEWRPVQSNTAMRIYSAGPSHPFPCGPHHHAVPRRSHPAKPGEGFDAPPTL